MIFEPAEPEEGSAIETFHSSGVLRFTAPWARREAVEHKQSP